MTTTMTAEAPSPLTSCCSGTSSRARSNVHIWKELDYKRQHGVGRVLAIGAHRVNQQSVSLDDPWNRLAAESMLVACDMNGVLS